MPSPTDRNLTALPHLVELREVSRRLFWLRTQSRELVLGDSLAAFMRKLVQPGAQRPLTGR